jgi:hypothetical protein
MADNMVERVARILEPQAWAALGTGDTLAYRNRRTSSLRKARAVLTALREPSNTTMTAGAQKLHGFIHGKTDPKSGAWQVWQAMINAALKGE